MMTVLALAPSASAGYLVNLEDDMVTGIHAKFGGNVAGGQGDTLDVGLGNHQCSDEEDVVDIGVFNTEGDASCAFEGRGCHNETGHDPTPTVIGQSVITPSGPGDEPGHCSDDNDTVDIGVFNREGGFRGEPWMECDQEPWWFPPPEEFPHGEEPPKQPPGFPHGGDEGDAVDVGVLNREACDADDANDVGVLNCEAWDNDDGLDVGVANREWARDDHDTFDLSLLNSEDGDLPDHNGLNVFTGRLGDLGCAFVVDGLRLPRVGGIN